MDTSITIKIIIKYIIQKISFQFEIKLAIKVYKIKNYVKLHKKELII